MNARSLEKVPINKIIPFSLVDGPGSRTSIFVQGCNIRCGYCHNPETRRLCANCGICVKNCPGKALLYQEGTVQWNPGKCIDCGQCIASCPYDSTPKTRMMDAGQVFGEIQKGIPFIRGITVSGGECMLYPQFLTELFTLAKRRSLTCLADSNGMVEFKKYPQLLEACDGVMLDVKSWNGETHRRLTGAGGQVVKENLKFLAERDKLEEIRIVCLPGQVDAEEAIRGIQKTIPKQAETVGLKLILFRNYGVKGPFAQFQPPSMEYMEGLKKLAMDLGFGKIQIT